MNWQWLRHAVVSVMLLTIALFILSTKEKFWWCRPSAEEHTPDGKLTVLKAGLFGWQNVWLSKLQFTSCKLLCFWQCKREHRPAVVTSYTHLLPVAKHRVTWWRAWLNEDDFCLADAQRSDGHRSTAAGIFALASSDLMFFLRAPDE